MLFPIDAIHNRGENRAPNSTVKHFQGSQYNRKQLIYIKKYQRGAFPIHPH